MSDMLTKLPIKSHAFSKPNIMDEGFESQLQFYTIVLYSTEVLNLFHYSKVS